jgi:hypothetical protein
MLFIGLYTQEPIRFLHQENESVVQVMFYVVTVFEEVLHVDFMW